MKILNNDELNLKMESMGGEKVQQAIELFTEMKDSKEFNKINIYKDFLEEKALELNVDINKKGMKSFINFAVKEVNEKYNLFDSFGIEEGEFENRWRLRLNISKEEILDICNKQY